MRYRRVFNPGATYFFTVNLQDRKSQLLINQIDKLRLSFKRIHTLYPFEIEAVVILPDHFHLMMTLPKDDSNFSLRLRLIKSSFSHQIHSDEQISLSRKKKGERGVWQRRFWEHLIRDDRDYEQHINYIHYNPVKHGYVSRAVEWAYSSIHWYIKTGVLMENWGLGGISESLQFGE